MSVAIGEATINFELDSKKNLACVLLSSWAPLPLGMGTMHLWQPLLVGPTRFPSMCICVLAVASRNAHSFSLLINCM